MRADIEAFQRRLAYQFTNLKLLEQALTHRSFGAANNERLEFLGDAVLDLSVGEILYEKFPQADEGGLSNLRSQMVCQGALAAKAKELGISEVLTLGQSASRSGGHQRESILSDAFEALVGAIFLDGGWEAARDFARRFMVVEDSMLEGLALRRDAKSRLQEFLQAKRLPPPQYQLKEISGPGHNQTFSVVCRVGPDVPEFEGTGASRRTAEQVAAARSLDFLMAQSAAQQ